MSQLTLLSKFLFNRIQFFSNNSLYEKYLPALIFFMLISLQRVPTAMKLSAQNNVHRIYIPCISFLLFTLNVFQVCATKSI